MVVGTLSLIQKGQTSGYSMQWMQSNSDIWWWGHSLWGKKVKPEDAVDAVFSRLVVYGGGDVVFGAKSSNQWMQWMQSHSGHSKQWMQWMQYAVDAVCSGHSRIVVYGGGDIVFCGKRSNQRLQWMQYAVDKRYMVVGTLFFGAKRSNQWMQWMQSHSGHSTQWTQYAVDAV